MNLINCIRKTPLYQGDEEYYNDLIGKKNVKQAIQYAERLNARIQENYNFKKELAMRNLSKLDIKDKPEQNVIKTVKKNPENEEDLNQLVNGSNTISSWDLDILIKKKSESFIIFDVRTKQDFENSHIKHPCCCNIPEDKLKAGYV